MEIWDLLQSHNRGTLSYADGVALFFRLWPQKEALRRFFLKEDKFSRQKLNAALNEKFLEISATKSQNDFIKASVPVNTQKPVLVDKLPIELRQEYALQGLRIREISSLHARLFNCSTDDQRLDLCRRIYHLTMERRATFNKVDAYESTGIVPVVPVAPERVTLPPDAPKQFDVEYKLKLLRSRRSKLKNKPNRAAEYAAVVSEIIELEKKRY